jgi:hypothetical protein
MPTILEIEDGNPWWNSHDIWVVPGNDPNGAPGSPIAGEPAFLWARVHNKGREAVSGARVNYYWSNPAAGVLRSNSTIIGSAFVDLNPGETKEVLCIIPWIPVIVNDGHECVVAEVIHFSDPLPSPLPDPFDPPTYRQIAQKNLTVLAMSMLKTLILPIQVAAPMRMEQQLLVGIEVGGTLDDRLLYQLGLKGHKPAGKVDPKVGLSLEPGCGEDGELQRQVRLSLKPGTARAVYLRVSPFELQPRTYALINVISRSAQKVVGGITYVVVKREEG